MKKPETLTKGEELLARALEECLDEDLSFVPPEGEIARTHRFTDAFTEKMREMMSRRTEAAQHEIRRHFSPRYGQLAACILIFCVCGALFFGVLNPGWDKSSDSAEESGGAMTEDAGDTSADDAYMEESAEAEEEPMEDAAVEESAAVTSGESDRQTVYRAAQQEIPDSVDGVTVKVNSPVQDEENPEVYLTIGNIGEDTVEYLDSCSLEVWLDDGWYVLPAADDAAPRTLELEAGMAVDEIVDLSRYQIDYSAPKYRLVTQVNGEWIGAEFTFSEEFSASMEE